MTRFYAKPTRVDGIRFDSQAEANRYTQLKILVASGDISALEVHPKLKLSVKGTRIGSGWYTADFQYKEANQIIVEDVKGDWVFRSGVAKTGWTRLRDLVCASHEGVTLRVTTKHGISEDWRALNGRVQKI